MRKAEENIHIADEKNVVKVPMRNVGFSSGMLCTMGQQKKRLTLLLSSKPRTIPIQDELNSECLRPRNSSISRLLRDLRLSRRSARAFLFYGRSRSLSRSFARSLCRRRRRRLTLLLLLPRVYILFSGTTDRRRHNPSATCRTCVQRHLRLNTCHHRKGNIERCLIVGKHRAHCLNTWPREREESETA